LIKPLFVFSLPRSGSTLVQRVLGSSGKISTVSEPWILLALLGHLKQLDSYAVYNHDVMVEAIDEFVNELPKGDDDYHAAVREMALSLYSEIADDNAAYFLDKTPRYHLVSDEIIKVFPDGKFIFLWRNPLAIIASSMETWAGGKWNLYKLNIDLYEGMACLVDAYTKNSSASFSVCYESLLSEGDAKWRELFAYLDIPFEPDVMVGFKDVELKGRMKDPTGVVDYKAINSEPVGKWKHALRNPVRKYWCRRYLRWLGRDRLAIMGYKLDDLIAEIDELPTSFKYIGSDLVGIVRGVLFTYFELTIFKDKLKKIIKGRRVYGHT